MPTGNEYNDVRFGLDKQTEQAEGEYGQATGPMLGKFTSGDDIVPSTVPSRQFSSKMSGDPRELLASTADSVDAHAEIISMYGYHQPAATLGSHPWLRDELADPTEREPGNAIPGRTMKVPFGGK